MVQPAVPAGRRHRGFREAVVDHPAPLEAQRRIDLAAARAVIGVAELVVADQLAVAAGVEQRVERRAVPPGEESQEETASSSIRPVALECAPMSARAGLWRGAPRLSSAQFAAMTSANVSPLAPRRADSFDAVNRGAALTPTLYIFVHNMLCPERQCLAQAVDASVTKS